MQDTGIHWEKVMSRDAGYRHTLGEGYEQRCRVINLLVHMESEWGRGGMDSKKKTCGTLDRGRKNGYWRVSAGCWGVVIL